MNSPSPSPSHPQTPDSPPSLPPGTLLLIVIIIIVTTIVVVFVTPNESAGPSVSSRLDSADCPSTTPPSPDPSTSRAAGLLHSMFNNRRFNIAVISTIYSWSVVARNPPTGSEDNRMRSGEGAGGGGVLKDIPQYVLDYAPLVHLNSKEYFWPSDMSEHLEHVQTYINETRVAGPATVDHLGDLNALDGLNGRWVYLDSDDYIDMWRDANIEGLPQWLTGEHNVPVLLADDAKVQSVSGLEDLPSWDEDFDVWHTVGPKTVPSKEELPPARSERRSAIPIEIPNTGGRSSAPAVLIVVEKGDGVVDAFWFFFYSYNLGNSVFTFRFGNHVGDWEHATMRFYNGVPKVMFLSEHEGGKGFTYHTAEKYGKRPVIYSASGTHAMYPTPGIQDYVLPFRILRDQTDKGPLWDPLLNIYSYHYDTAAAADTDRTIRSLHDPQADTLSPSTLSPDAPTSWFYYGGHWGDKYYPRADHRQYQLGTEKAYVSGPFGPRFKALGRHTVCPNDNCVIKDSIAPRGWALRFFIDYLFAVAIVWLIAGLVIACMWCCGFRRSRRSYLSKAEADIDPVPQLRLDPEVEVTERSSLLTGDELVRQISAERSRVR